MKCPFCGSEVLVDTLICEHCGRDAGKVIDKWEDEGPPATDKALQKPLFSAPLPRGPSRPPPPPWAAHDGKATGSYYSLLGSALIFLGGVAAVAESLLLLYFNSPSTIIALIPLKPMALGSMMIAFGIIAMAGGALGFRRIWWPFVLAGAIFSILSLGWFYLSLLFGLIGLVLLGKTRDEFD